jgi:hypothetical protein
LAKAAPGCSGQLYAGEALTPDVLDDVGEGDEAGDALGEIHPVAGPGVDIYSCPAAEGDEDAVESVEGERDEDEGPLEHADEREGVEELYLQPIRKWPIDGFVVGEDVLDEEGADGDDAGERVQLAPEEGVALAGVEGLDAADFVMGCGRRGGCHGLVCSCDYRWRAFRGARKGDCGG